MTAQMGHLSMAHEEGRDVCQMECEDRSKI